MRFEHAPADRPPAADLIAAMVAEMNELYDGTIDAGPNVSTAPPAELAPPGGACLLGYEDDRAVCVGAVKRFDARTAEIKRMYVVPDARGGGVARLLLGALESAARELGYRRARLDTGRFQPHVQRLFEDAGYAGIEDYNGNPYASWWGEREL
ncbi:MAG: GCN5-related N-acetyltransferase [Solirubrobacterales bacterium]|nr:GCN5-related N-acetyltransferase [Solirubrobacterales bacterium]